MHKAVCGVQQAVAFMQKLLHVDSHGIVMRTQLGGLGAGVNAADAP